jgi:hypothetical protein
MKILLKTLSLIAILMTIVPSILVFNGNLDLETNKKIMTVGMLLWFAVTPFWMDKKAKSS